MGRDSIYFGTYAGRKREYHQPDERADRSELQSSVNYSMGRIQ